MAYDISAQARKRIAAITDQLDPALLKRRFDEPVDRVARHFTHQAGCPLGHQEFHRVITDFVVSIYDQGLDAGWMVSFEPGGVAIELLEAHYHSAHGRGYIAAILDANHAQEGGIDAVLVQLAEIIKSVERQKYVNAVFALHIDPTDWHLKCEMAKLLLIDYRSFLPTQLQECQPCQLANQIPSMMFHDLGSDTTLEELVCYL